MPASVHDSSSTDDRSTTPDVSGDESPDEDAESDNQSCGSYISDKDGTRTAEDDVDEKLEIYRANDHKWVPIQARHVDVQDCEWISEIELYQRFDVLREVGERSLDAIAVLAEIVGGPAGMQWLHVHDLNITYVCTLQLILILVMSSKGAWSNTSQWWDHHVLYIPSQEMCHFSWTSSFFEGRLLLDLSPNRPWKDLAEVLRIALPYFREMNARIDALSKRRNLGYSPGSSDSASIFGPTNMANLVTCLDIAESVAKLVPVFGNVLEGACGILRKTVQAAENARSARDECRALAEHTASITLAILNKIGPASTLSGADINRICDLRETIKIVDFRVQSLSKLGWLRYLASRGRITTEVMELRSRVDNARIAFNIRSDISTTQLLTDLKIMQTRLASRVEDIYEGQKATHNMLQTLLVDTHTVMMQFRGHRTGDACVAEADCQGGRA
ncbi:hypothetical protein BDZ89DRAFT_1063385 [Hymenopellis radicata]|nr:hypothetical protein BDZ89DRAFT_1063385 [Hymenopellis radicata]